MKIVFISDTHEKHWDLTIPKCDVLVHCGDHSFRPKGAAPETELPNLQSYGDWCQYLIEAGTVKYAITIAGNHDFAFEQLPSQAIKALGSYVTYLQDFSVEIDGLSFYGSPWTRRLKKWAFHLSNQASETFYDDLPYADVLITHGPAYDWLDVVEDGERIGCTALAKAVLRTKPKIHACGHIHESYGIARHSFDSILRVNACSCNLQYKPLNAPIMVELR